jgi:putative flippase GtrA
MPEGAGRGTAGRLRRLLPTRRFVAFFLGSGAGLVVDLGGFSLLVALGIAPGIANLCSSFASITVVYVLVTRYSFGVGTKPATYVLFVAWYSLAIVVFSTLIEWAVVSTGLPPIVCKLASVPFSFSLNYGFSRLLFRRR